MEISCNARILATLIHCLDEKVFDKTKYPCAPVTIVENNQSNFIFDREDDDDTRAAYCYRINNGYIYDEHYYINESVVGKDSDLASLIMTAAHEVKHRAQKYYKNTISISWWKKVVLFYNMIESWKYFFVLLRKASEAHWRHKKLVERDAYFIGIITYNLVYGCNEENLNSNLNLIAKIVLL